MYLKLVFFFTNSVVFVAFVEMLISVLSFCYQNAVEKPVHTKPSYDGDVLDSVLSHVGDMGRYQKVLYVAMIPFGFIYAFTYFVQMFITVAPQNYWCRVPELAGLSMELRYSFYFVFICFMCTSITQKVLYRLGLNFNTIFITRFHSCQICSSFLNKVITICHRSYI